MGFKHKCSSCGVDNDIEGVMLQSAHVERLKAKDDENKALRDELKTTGAKAREYDTAARERDEAKGELTKIRTAAERHQAFAEHGIADEKARAGFEVLYSSHVAGLEDDKRPTFADWLKADDTRGHPLLAAHFKQTSTGTQQPQQKVVQPPPRIDNGVVQNTGQQAGIKTGEQLQAYLNSPEYRSLPKAEQRKALAAVRQQRNAQPG